MRFYGRSLLVVSILGTLSLILGIYNYALLKTKRQYKANAATGDCRGQMARKDKLGKMQCPRELADLVKTFDIPSLNSSTIPKAHPDDLFLIQVIQGSIYVESKNLPNEMIFEKDRREAFLQLLKYSLPHMPIHKDFELLLSVKDCCLHKDIPLFSVTRCTGSQQLPYAQWNKIRDGPLSAWNRRMRRQRQKADKRPWRDRKSTAVFRGSVSRKWSFDEEGRPEMTRLTEDNWRRVGRTIMAHLANQTMAEDLLDVQLRHVNISSFPFTEAVAETTMEQQAADFKYTVIAEGNCGWADRFKTFLSMGTLCFLQQTPCQEYYTLLASPFRQYVPVSGNLSNLTSAIRWAREHDSDAIEIAGNGARFANTFLTEHSIKCYMVELFREYQTRYEGAVRLRRGKAMSMYQ